MSVFESLGRLVGLVTGRLGVPVTLALVLGAVVVLAAWGDF